MSIVISVSKSTEEKIRRRAAKTGENVEKVVSDLVEGVWDEHFPDDLTPAVSKGEFESPFKPFIGMFSSGKMDTSERMHELLYGENFDPAEGFSVK